ncbi:formate dehydrogenase [Sphingobium sp. LB126]|uniref:formate dehydrogenase subunit delta n=1 Tax=Sphingobium sp. LB126 TaxID=1983755 RepID=UPI000C20C623|nr:formate dehydrogenase subunit delta [Sphingobium sp. LB126]PJG46340.1 formate dehydrogenase [Sphingobium sp. LB126]
MSDENHVMSTEDRLIYMVNQIARNVAALGEEAAVTTTADHIRDFWDPAMKQHILALTRTRPEQFSAIAAAAVGRISVP